MTVSLTWMCLIGFALTIIAACSAASTDHYDRPSNPDIHQLLADTANPTKRSSFFLGSRYGRSQANTPAMRNLNVVPRNNRFFTGSRYGKRSGENMQEIVEPEPSRMARYPADGAMMQCRYTGVKDFYQCSDVMTNNSENHISGDSNETSGIDADK